MRKIEPKLIEENAIELIESQWMLVTAGTMESFNMMTANWGALGELWFKDVAFVFIRPQRYTFEFTEESDYLTLSFFDESHREALNICGRESGRDIDKVAKTGLTPYQTECGSVAFREAKLVLECRKLYADRLNPDAFVVPELAEKCYKNGDYHQLYVCEIVNAWIK